MSITKGLSPILGTAVASTSGTSIDFTGLPAGVKRITMLFAGVSTNGTTDIRVKVGSGSILSTGYVTSIFDGTTDVVAGTDSFTVWNGGAAAAVLYGQLTLFLFDPTTNQWVASGQVSATDSNRATRFSAGSVTLSGALDRIQLTANGTDTFDAGKVNIQYQ